MKHINQVQIPRALIVISAAFALCGCGGGAKTPQTYSLSGTVGGLTKSGLVLSVNGMAVTLTSGATSVTFAKGLASGSEYTVSVQTQPTGLNCSVARGAGTIATVNVTNIAVTCVAASYTIGGSISGLTASGLVLLDNEGDATQHSRRRHAILDADEAGGRGEVQYQRGYPALWDHLVLQRRQCQRHGQCQRDNGSRELRDGQPDCQVDHEYVRRYR